MQPILHDATGNLTRNATLKAALFAIGLCAAGASQAQTYQFVLLGEGSARGINDLGQVVGQTMLGATLWSGGTSTLLQGGANSAVGAINDAGLIVGGTNPSMNTPSVPVTWNGATQTALPIGSFGNGWANDINSSGQIVGNASNDTKAVLWSNGSFTTLPVGIATFQLSATAINNNGLIAGYAEATYGTRYAVSWNGSGNGNLLGSLGGSMSQANAINDKGEIVGQSTNAAGIQYATEWNGSTAIQLQSLGGSNSYAYAVNDAGTVVGASGDSTGHMYAAMWNGTSIVNLNSLLTPAEQQAGWVLNTATGINQNGWITGTAYNTRFSGSEVFELKVVSAVPEADTWAMLLAGLGLIGVCGKRRGKRAITAPA